MARVKWAERLSTLPFVIVLGSGHLKVLSYPLKYSRIMLVEII